MFRAPCAHRQEAPDGCIILIQFYLGVLVLVYLLCLFCITNFDILLTVHLNIFILIPITIKRAHSKPILLSVLLSFVLPTTLSFKRTFSIDESDVQVTVDHDKFL